MGGDAVLQSKIAKQIPALHTIGTLWDKERIAAQVQLQTRQF